MKSILTISILIAVNLCLCTHVNAQVVTIPEIKMPVERIDFPPLAVLIDSAIKNNSMIDYRTHDIEVRLANLSSQRRSWLRNMGVQADSRYGTFDNFSSNAGTGQSTTLLSVTSKQFNYGAGLYLKLPLYDILNRKTQIKQAKAEVEEAKDLVQAQRNEIAILVTKQYEDVILKHKLVIIKSQNLGSAMVNKEMVEKEYRNGIIPTSEYVRLSDMISRIQSEYEMAKSDFVTGKKILEELAGFKFQNPDLSEK